MRAQHRPYKRTRFDAEHFYILGFELLPSMERDVFESGKATLLIMLLQQQQIWKKPVSPLKQRANIPRIIFMNHSVWIVSSPFLCCSVKIALYIQMFIFHMCSAHAHSYSLSIPERYNVFKSTIYMFSIFTNNVIAKQWTLRFISLHRMNLLRFFLLHFHPTGIISCFNTEKRDA